MRFLRWLEHPVNGVLSIYACLFVFGIIVKVWFL